MKSWRGVALGLVLLAASAVPAAADNAGGYALSLMGEPKYGPGFTHFDYVNPDAPKGGTLRIPGFGTFDNLNPFIVRGTPAVGAGLVFGALTESSSDETFTEYGALAQTITLAPDKTWIEFTLRPEAKFNDGTPVTAEDVVWSFETLRDKGNPVYRNYYADVTSAAVTGERTVRFTFANTTNKELPVIIGQLSVLPKHAFEGKDFAATTLEPMVGSGPYRVESVEPGRSITYVRVKDWWGANLPVYKGHFNFERIRVDYYRDLNVMFEAFKADAYDYTIERTAKNWATGYDVPAVKDGTLIKEAIPDGDPAGITGFVYNLRRPIFADRRVRQAIAQLLDFEWSNKTLFYGQYRRERSFFTNSELEATGLPGPDELAILEPLRGKVPDEVFTKEFQPPVTDGSGNIRTQLRDALALLKEAGWELKGNTLVNAAGQPLRFEILSAQTGMDRVVLPFVANLKRVGIDASFRIVDVAQYLNRVNGFDYDMIIGSFPQSLSPGNEQREFWGSKAADEPGSRNVIGIKDPVIDGLVDALIAAPDRKSLIAHARVLDRVLAWNYYLIPYWFDDQTRYAYWSRLAHPAVQPKYNAPLIASTWWFDPAKDAKISQGKANNTR